MAKAAMAPTMKRSLVAAEDVIFSALSNLQPTLVKSAIQSAEAGNITTGLQVFERLLASQPIVRIPVQLRQSAVKSAKWTLVGGSDEARAVVLDVLDKFGGVEELASDLVLGLIIGVYGYEIVWGDSTPEELVYIPSGAWRWHPKRGLYLMTGTTEVEIIEDKFLYVTLGRANKNPIMESPLRAAVGLLVSAYYGYLAYQAFLERYAMPITSGTYPADTTPDAPEVTEFKNALTDFGASGVIVMPEGFDIKLHQYYAPPAQTPFMENLRYVSNQVSRLLIGGVLSTDAQGKGSYAAAAVHDQIRQEIRLADVNACARAINRQLVKPIVKYAIGPDAEAPEFKPIIETTVDKDKAEVYKTLSDSLGIKFDPKSVADDVGVPHSFVVEDGVTSGGEDG